MLETARVRRATPIRIGRALTAANLISATSDTLSSGVKAQRAVIRFIFGSGATSMVCLAKHAASTNRYSSATATAFTTVVSSVLTSNTTAAWDINLANCKRYLIVKMSGVGNSCVRGCVIDYYHNSQFPTSAAQGDTTYTRIG